MKKKKTIQLKDFKISLNYFKAINFPVLNEKEMLDFAQKFGSNEIIIDLDKRNVKRKKEKGFNENF